ncbi:hypothetical protein JB92DRAFT_1373887 [Gautieria morchelliformis]|nr:hypothetical protein JB92DRAFT_1373887 [Gautieria morchelliformis]
MTDISFRASSSTDSGGPTGSHASVNCRDVTAYKRKSLMDSTSSKSGAEASVAVGTERTRGRLDEPEEKYSSLAPSGTRDVCFDVDPVSTIVMGAKRVGNSDSAENRDYALHQSLFIAKNHQEEQEPVPQTAINHTGVLIIPARASLAGLPEELIIDVLTELSVGDVMSLRRTNKRLAYITRDRAIWINHLCQLLDHLQIAQGTATFLPSQVSSRDLEHAVIRPYIFDYRWLRSSSCNESPMTSKVLSTGWSEPEDIRFPILMPGGRWLIAAYDHPRSSISAVCLWDLDHGTLKQLPEAQMIAEGRVTSMDAKMDRTGRFAFLVILSEKENFAPPRTLLHQIDVYQVIFKDDDDNGISSFTPIDTFFLGRQQGSEPH